MLKTAQTPHKSSADITMRNTEKPSHRQNPAPNSFSSSNSSSISPIKYYSKPSMQNKENFSIERSPTQNSRSSYNEKSHSNKKKPKSLINASKILKILNLTTKYEGLEGNESENTLENEEKKLSLKSPNEKIYQNNQKEQKSPLPNNKYMNENQQHNRKSQKNLPKKPIIIRKFSLEELLQNPLQYYENLQDVVNCEQALKELLENISIKGLMTVKSLIKPDKEIIRICGSFCILQEKTQDSAPFSWSSIQKSLSSPSHTLKFMREFAVLVQKGEKFNEEALSLAKKNILLPNNGGVLSQNLEIYPVNETIKKIFAFTLLALRYFELHKNNEINEDKEEFYQEAETPKHFYNEFLEEEVPSVLKVQPSKPQLIENSEFEAFDKEKERFNEKKNDKTNERINKKLNNSIDDYKKYDNNKGKPQNNKERTLKMDAGLNETKQIFKDQLRSRTDRPSKKEEIINKMLNKQKIMNNQRSLFYDEVLDKRKKSLLQKKETKFEKIMKIKVRKPKAISQIRLQLNASNILISSPLKNEYKTKRNKSLNLSQNSMFSKQDNSETIGERLVKEDMVTLQKEMKKLASQKAKLNNAFNRELKKVEEFKKLKEIERERRRERELEQRFLEKKSFETKQEKKSIKEDKYSEYYKNRQVKKQNFENKRHRDLEEIQNYEKHHNWLEKEKEKSKEKIKEKNIQEKEQIEFIRSTKMRKAQEEKKQVKEDIQRNKESLLLQKHKDMRSQKEHLEKQLEETLEVIMKIRESYKDLDLE